MPPTAPLDAQTRAAMARWPGVPDCYGWLALDRRGRWLVDGQCVAHAGLAAFIGRNYRADGAGRWYFQNGPQRVFVRLASAPWVLALLPDGGLQTHTGRRVATIERVLIADAGDLYLATDLGPAALGSASLASVLEHLVDARGRPLGEHVLEALAKGEQAGDCWFATPAHRAPLAGVAESDVEAVLGFVREPAAPDG